MSDHNTDPLSVEAGMSELINCTCIVYINQCDKIKKVVCINFTNITELDEDAVRDPTLLDDFDPDG